MVDVSKGKTAENITPNTPPSAAQAGSVNKDTPRSGQLPLMRQIPESGKTQVAGSATLHDHQGRELNLDGTRTPLYRHPNTSIPNPQLQQGQQQYWNNQREQEVDLTQGQQYQGNNNNQGQQYQGNNRNRGPRPLWTIGKFQQLNQHRWIFKNLRALMLTLGSRTLNNTLMQPGLWC